MNRLFNKVLGENEKYVFYFYLKTEGTFWPTQYFTVQYCIEYNSTGTFISSSGCLEASIKAVVYSRLCSLGT